jgi:hypothetical protein
MKVRRVSGRHQISGDGKRLYDGIAFGRPLLRIPSGRPDIVIPPRKRARLTIPDVEDGDEDEDYEGDSGLALEGHKDVLENNDRQLVLHPEFNDADEDKNNSTSSEGKSDNASEHSDSSISADDNDLSSDDDEDMEDELKGLLDDVGMDTDGLQSESSGRGKRSKPSGAEAEDKVMDEDNDSEALADVPDEHDREKIRKLHAAFPDSALGLCKHVLQGAEGDLGMSWVALSEAFKPAMSKRHFTKSMKANMEAPVSMQPSMPTENLKQAISQIHLLSPATQPRSRKRSAAAMQSEENDSPEPQPSEFSRFDHQGLPAGSIQSGRALSFMADVVKGSSARGRTGSLELASANPRKIIFDASEEIFSGLTSTPLIDKEVVEAQERSSGRSSSESDDDSSEDSSDESNNENEPTDGNIEPLNPIEESTSVSKSGSSDTSDSDSSDGSEEEEVSNSFNPQEIELEDDDNEGSVARASTPFTSASDEESSSPSDSDDSSDSSGDDAPEEAPSKHVNDGSVARATTPLTSTSDEESSSSSDSDDSSGSSGDDAPEEAPSKPAPQVVGQVVTPHEGSRSTKARNERNRKKNIRNRYQRTGILPAGTTVEDLQKTNSGNKPKAIDVDEFETRRQKLLADISSGGVAIEEFPTNSSSHATTRPSTADLNASQPMVVSQKLPGDAQSNSERPLTAPEVETNTLELAKVAPASADSSQIEVVPRKTRLDLGAAKRMLFSNLGFKAPKTKQDEDYVRASLMKDVRPMKTVAPADNTIGLEGDDEYLDSWREKINYSARECVDEDVELSEPPFPFVQRWDPQQQIRKKNKGGNNDHRNNSQYYQPTFSKSKRQKTEPESGLMLHEDSTQLSADVESEVAKQLVGELNSIEESHIPDDLNALPEDISCLPDLRDNVAKPGMIIAFKQLELSEATKWQPQESGYRTAIVIEVLDDGSIDMTLAKRDRIRSEKRYNEDGDRIYGKFEMPDEDEDDEEDDGKLCLSFDELFGPKIVADVSTGEKHDISADRTWQLKEGPSADESVTLSHEVPSHDEEPEAQCSHITETVLDSDAPDPSLSDEAQESGIQAHRNKHDGALSPTPRVSDPSFDDVEMTDAHIAGNGHDHPEEEQPKAHPPNSLVNESESVEVRRLDREVGKHIASTVADNEELPGSDYQVSKSLVSDLINAQLSGETVDSLPHAQIETSSFESKATSIPVEEVQQVAVDENMAGQSPGSDAKNAAESLEGATLPVFRAENTNGSAGEIIENREDISAIFQEAGWSKDVPESILNNLYHDKMTSPDVSIFEKLRQDMAEINQDVPYSPEFTGFGSSPPRVVQEPSANSLFNRGQSPALSFPEPKQSSEVPAQQAAQDSEPPRSSWHTADEDDNVDDDWEDEGDSSDGSDDSDIEAARAESDGEVDTKLPLQPEEGHGIIPLSVASENEISRSNSVAETNKATLLIDESPLPKSLSPPAKSPEPKKIIKQKSPAKPAVKRKSKKLPRVSEFLNAEHIWKTMQQKPQKAANPSQKTKEVSPAMNLDGADKRESNSVEHPKVSVNSSFTSDHGRQPDFDFNDSTIILGADSALNLVFNQGEDDDNVQEPESTPKKISGKDEKSTLLSRNVVDEKKPRPSRTKELSDNSDSDLPDIREIASQLLPKREKVSPFRRGPTSKKTNENRAQSQGSDQSTPRKAKKPGHRSASIKPPAQSSQAQGLQSQRQPYVPPEDTQITDLTISSDIEPDSPPKRTTPKRKGRTNNIGEHDEEEWGGYVGGKDKSEPRETRNGSVGLRNSSQTVLNSKGKRGGSK